MKQARESSNPVAAKRDAKQAERTSRELAEDAAVLRAVADAPGISTRDLATRVQALAHIGRERAVVAIARASDQLDVRPGERPGSRRHFVKGGPTP